MVRIVRPGDEGTARWTFTSDRWLPRSKIAIERSVAVIEDVWATQKRRGFFRDLLNALEHDGFDVLVQTPLEEMRPILIHYGFVERLHWWKTPDGEEESVSRWRRGARA